VQIIKWQDMFHLSDHHCAPSPALQVLQQTPAAAQVAKTMQQLQPKYRLFFTKGFLKFTTALCTLRCQELPRRHDTIIPLREVCTQNEYNSGKVSLPGSQFLPTSWPQLLLFRRTAPWGTCPSCLFLPISTSARKACLDQHPLHQKRISWQTLIYSTCVHPCPQGLPT